MDGGFLTPPNLPLGRRHEEGAWRDSEGLLLLPWWCAASAVARRPAEGRVAPLKMSVAGKLLVAALVMLLAPVVLAA